MDEPDFIETKATCPECGVVFSVKNGGHCRGGVYGGCCRTFSSDFSFTAHRKGPWDQRYCVPVDSTQEWRHGRLGWTDRPSMDSEASSRAWVK